MNDNEKLNSAETAAEAANADSDAVVSTDNDSVNDASFEDPSADGEGTTAKDDAAKPQTREDNAYYARKRREAERKAEIRSAEEKARNQAIIDALDGVNPYTNEKMVDSFDVDEYLAMKKIAKAGGDPIADFHKASKKADRERDAETKRATDQRAWLNADRAEFEKKHPTVSIAELAKDELFVSYAGDRVGKVPLSTLYEEYADIIGQAEERANRKAAQAQANSAASVGALTDKTTPPATVLTREDVAKMSQREVDERLDEIKAAMKNWK